MFNIDKEKLKQHMSAQINNVYVPRPIYNSNSNLDQVMNEKIAFIINDNNNSIKSLLKEVINELIDHLYTIDDFEKDIKLK